MPTPSELTRLAERLAAMTAAERVALAKRAGVRPQIAHRGAEIAGRDNVKVFEAAAFVQLCAACGLDPMTGEDIDVSANGAFVPEHFALAVRLARMAGKLTQREAAKAWGVEKTVPYRAEKAAPISVGPLLTLCRAMNRHPFEFMRCTMFHGKHDVRQERSGAA
jgi:DNA-binding XRE family transcriptional regulator